ncbi:hypothetical protein MG9_02272, partial [Candida albicans P37037]
GCCSCDSLINIALCMLGYFPGLIHSWYIIAKYPPYYYQQQQQQRKDTIYYVYRSDLENQTPRRDGRDGRDECHHDHHHHHHHHHNQAESQSAGLIVSNNHNNNNNNYGSVVEGSSSSNLTPVAPIPVENGAPPPAYTEIDNKTQH